MKPQDVFLGVRDFLSLLVPGIIFLLLFPTPVLPLLSKPIRIGGGNPDPTLLVLVFLAAALTAGSLLAGLAGLLDARVDGYIQRRLGPGTAPWCPAKLARQIDRLGQIEKLAADLAGKINPLATGSNAALPWTPRSFWWNYLRLNCPVATAELDRIEGLQKQFRSLVVVALAAALFAIGTPVRWDMLNAPWNTITNLNAAFTPLWAFLPWFLAGSALLVGAFCFVAYVGYRVRFACRLFELAIIHALPDDTVTTGTTAFFSRGMATVENAESVHRPG